MTAPLPAFLQTLHAAGPAADRAGRMDGRRRAVLASLPAQQPRQGGDDTEGKSLAIHLGKSPGRGAMVRLGASLRQWRQAAAGRRMLARLTDRELRDIGLTRGDVYREMAGAPPDGPPRCAADAGGRPGHRPPRRPDQEPSMHRALLLLTLLLPACGGPGGAPLLRAGGQYSGMPDTTVGDWRYPAGTLSTGGVIVLDRELPPRL